MRKVRIARKRKPWLHNETQYLHNVSRGLTTLLDIFVRQPILAQQRAEKIRIANENREQDTRLKSMRESLIAEQLRRTELLNAEKRLRLENKYGAGKVAEAMGEAPQGSSDFTPVNYG